ncbi:MAG: peptidylprolyl isomerase SurA [Arsenophonus sp.]
MNYFKKLIISLLFTISSITQGSPIQLDKVNTIVNDSIILQSDIENMLNIVRINSKNSEQQIPDENILRYQILERLIIDEIILQIAKKIQIKIPDQEIDLSIANIAEQNKLTVSQLQKQLIMNGINFQNYRNDICREMMIAEVRNNEVRRRIRILMKEVDSLVSKLNYQAEQDINVNLSHILIPLMKNSTNKQSQSALDIANKIVSKLKHGDDFNKLSITYSSDSNAMNGGKIGWKKLEELPTIFFQKIQLAKKHDIIGPIRSTVGFHILKLNDIKKGNIPIFVTEMKLRHILIKISPIMNNEQAYAKIQEIAKKIQTNQITFDEAAKQYSQDSSSSSSGGELGWSVSNSYDPAFRDALVHLSKGEITQPIYSSFGWHLIQLEDTRQVDKTYIIQKDNAYRLLFDRKFNEEAQIWIEELRESAYVKILNNSEE